MPTKYTVQAGVASVMACANMFPGVDNMEQAFNASPVAQAMLDAGCRVQRANAAWIVRTGSDPSGLLWLGLVHPDDRDVTSTQLGRLRTDGPGSRLAIRIAAGVEADGWLEAIIETTPIQDGILITMLPAPPVGPGIVAEHRIIAAALSHDLRQHARLVSSYLSLLVRTGLAGVDRERLNMGIECSGRLLAELSGLASWLRLNDRVLDRSPCDLADLVRRVSGTLPGLTAEMTDLPLVEADPVLLEELFMAVLTNAVSYGAPPVRVMARRVAGSWEISVSDHGPGIPESERTRVLEPLRRLHTWQEVPGHGMGLALAARIAIRHGGSLSIVSAPEGGAQVLLTLPA